jgi:hypothetical protein
MIARQAAIAALVVAPGIACGGSTDAAVFESATTQPATAEATGATTGEPTAGDVTSTTTAVTRTTGDTTTTSASTSTSSEASPTTAGTFPAGAEMAVSFTFSPSSGGGRIENPYVAVWVEDGNGTLVKTVSLWYEQSSKGTKYLNDLRQWANLEGAASGGPTSGATRVAGDYTVVWDGTDLDGQLVAQGEYVVYIEAAREHGPYEITSVPVTIGGDAFDVTFDDNGELTNATAELIV